MFIENRYNAIYNSLIQRAKYRLVESNTYCETHHVIPKSLGGDDSDTNLVKLTFKEHILAHHLLTKMVIGDSKKKMCYAYRMMRYRFGCRDGTYRKISPLSETRQKISDTLKITFTTNPEIRKNLIHKRSLQSMSPHSELTKAKIRESNKKFWDSDASSEAKAKISEKNKGKKYALGCKRSNEFKDNLSDLKRDHTAYAFINTHTGQKFLGTRKDFCVAYNISPDSAYTLTTGRVLVSRSGWSVEQ